MSSRCSIVAFLLTSTTAHFAKGCLWHLTTALRLKQAWRGSGGGGEMSGHIADGGMCSGCLISCV